MEAVILGLLILLNGFFALSEIALVSSKKARLEQSRLEGNKGAGIALQLLEDSTNFLSAIQVGITLISIITGVYGGTSIADHVTPLFQKIAGLGPYADEIALTLTVLVITYISIVIGELVPKAVALSQPEKVAARIAPVIYYISAAFFPFVRMLSASTSLLTKMAGINQQRRQMTEAELRQMIKLASREGVIEKEQNLLHEKVFYFSDKKAKHIMTHRTEVEWINLDESPGEIYKTLLVARHSQVVCSRGELDNFEGVLFLKDYFRSYHCDPNFDLSSLMIAPVIIPESADAQKVLDKLKETQRHMCFVVNEYGGFEGIITVHDILENIVGQIPQEGEPYEPEVFVRSDKSVLVSGDAPIETLAEIIEDFVIDFEKIEYSTVAGFMLSRLNKIPQIGDSIRYRDYTIEVVDIDANRIDKLLVRKTNDKND